MRRLIALILLLFILLNIFGYQVVYLLRRHEIKEEMIEFLKNKPDDKLVTEFRIDLNDKKTLDKFEWEEEHEFRLDGEMYDVIEKKAENGALIIRCVNDRKESDLVRAYQEINKDRQDNSSSKNPSAILFKLMGANFIVLTHNEFLFSTNREIIFYDTFSDNIPSQCLDVLIPPPKSA